LQDFVIYFNFSELNCNLNYLLVNGLIAK
jgi:hypothetical protein